METKYNLRYADMTGTYYHKETQEVVCDILEESRISQKRIKIEYGNVKTGESWGVYDICYIGRSTGDIKIPLVIKTCRSYGGTCLLDNCIIRISHANKKNGGIIYELKK